MNMKILKKEIVLLFFSFMCFSGLIWAISVVSFDEKITSLNIAPVDVVADLDNNTTINDMDEKNVDKENFREDSSNYASETILNSLVADQQGHNSNIIPNNFRTTNLSGNNHRNMPAPDLTGLEELKAAASAQFSEGQLNEIIKRINPNDSKIIVVDLRNEFHAFINGDPVSFFSQRNNSFNWNKTPEEIILSEEQLFNDLKEKTEININKLKKDKVKVEYVDPKMVKIHEIKMEKDLVKKYGLDYARFFVRDHTQPPDRQIDDFVSFIRNLSPNTWLYFHCRGGVGRTTTFLAMYDIIANSDKVALEDIIQRQYYIGGSLLSKLPANNSYKFNEHKVRLKFIKKFYEYVVDPLGYREKTWSSWRALKRF